MPNLDVRSALTGLSIFLPPLPEQREIARILGTLDDKIELNHRMIVTLEAMARALFQSWFVDFDPVRAKAEGRQPVGIEAETAELFPDSFEDSALGSIPKGWKPRNIASFIDFTVNGDWGSNYSALGAETAAYCVRGADIPALRRGHCDTLPTRYISDKSLIKRMISDGDLVIEISGGSPTQSTGRVVYVSSSLLERVLKPVICSNFCRIIRPMKRSHGILVYGWLDHLYQRGVLFQFETGTTGIKNLSYKNVFTENMLAFPGDDLIQKFVQSVSHLHSQLVHVAGEVERIRVLRDTLLPKLLSGELRAGDVAA
jgi:type I restriction enzyme S subunit